MSKTTFALGFYCRKSKANRQGYSPIELGITISGKRVFINLPRQEKPLEFLKGYNNSSNLGYKDLNDYLSIMRVRVNEAITELTMTGQAVTADSLRDYIRTGGIKSFTIENLFADYMAILHKRVGTSLSKGVCRKYEYVMELFFTLVDKSKESVTISNKDILNFENKIKDYEQSSKAAMLTKLKTFIKFGMDNNHITVNPFQGIKIKKGEEKVEYLTDEELNMIANKPLNDRLSKVRDCFVFQACSGLSYADMAILTSDDVQEENGTYYINKKRVKTGIEYTAVILPLGVEIFNKYKGILPVLSNQKYNSYLKEIEAVCGLEKSLHSHLARKTYATHLLSKNVSYATIAKTLGHTQIKQTMHYAKVIKSNLLNEISKTF